MPQLNPAPWLMIMVMSWMSLLMLISPKVLSTTSQNLPTMYSQTPHETTPWNWPWA